MPMLVGWLVLVSAEHDEGVGVFDMTGAMEGRALFDGVDIEPSADGPVLATDRELDWGAAFRFWLSEDGDVDCDCVLAQRRGDGWWDDLGSGGARYGDWDVPWRPPEKGWPNGPMLVLATTGQTVYDAADEELDLIAVCGFVAPSVQAIRSIHDGRERTIPVASRVGAFVALAVGGGTVTLTPLSGTG
ncbi:MAG: hypothetical protein QOF96_2527, partial [Actinomycetota bacterium]|nr:hypothetical protein [Actinomycetota bacterium]